MLLIRLLAALVVIGVALSLLAWLLTGDPRFRAMAWRLFRAGMLLGLVFLLLLFAERLLIPFL